MEERGLSRANIGHRLSPVAGFCRFAVIDGTIEHSPAELRPPTQDRTESASLGLDRMELSAFIAQGSAVDQAPACCWDCSVCVCSRPYLSTSSTSG